MQEQRSGLWYLRTTEEVSSSGLFAHLDGFQTQVFINIHEVDDDATRVWRALYDSLKGRGVRDVHMGLQNIRLKDLYAALASFASHDFFANGIALIEAAETKATTVTSDKASADATPTPASTPTPLTPEGFVESLEQSALAFFEVAIRFLDEGHGTEALPGMPTAPRAKESVKLAADAWTLYSDSLLRFFALPSKPVKKELPKKMPPVKPQSSTEAISLEAIAPEAIPAEPPENTAHKRAIPAVLILHALRELSGSLTPGVTARTIVDLWSLDRKIADLAGDYGLEGPDFRDELASYTDTLFLAEDKPLPAKKTASLFLTRLFSDERLSRRVGVHQWDGIDWFNKEAAEAIAERTLLVAQIRDGREKSAAEYDAARDEILKAFAESGYRVDAIPTEKAKTEKVILKKDKPETGGAEPTGKPNPRNKK
jgi:hypothetical protein